MSPTVFPRASLKRSSRTRTRKNSIPADMDSLCRPSCSSILTRRMTRPPPLQIIPELSENELDIGVSPTHSPVTARPTQSFPQQSELETCRITLSAYTFSIDDALLMFGDDRPRSPALSASSSISDGASSGNVPTTPGTSDDEDGDDFMLPTPRLRPQRASIRPLRIAKTRSLTCQEDEDIHDYFKKEEVCVILPVTEERPDHPTEAQVATEAAEDFYAHEFEDFISLWPVIPSPTSPARRDSFTLPADALPTVTKVPEPKPQGRSRHSKPLPLLPPLTPPPSSFPLIPTFSLVQTTAQKSIVRRKRNILSLPNQPPPPSSSESRPLPRTAVPLNIEDCLFPEDNYDVPSGGLITIKPVYDAEEDASIYSQSCLVHTTSVSTRPLPPAIPETPISGMYGDVTLPRSSTDSDAPRSSVDSTSSFASSTFSNTPIPSFSFPISPSEGHEPESTQRLRSRWSSSTLASLAAEAPRTTTLLSPLKSVFGSRARKVLLPPQKTPPQSPPLPTPSKLFKNKHGFAMMPSPRSKHIRRRGSRSSTSSTGTSSSECDNHDGSPSGLKRKPIPLAMFLRAT
ncbi:hypothetical protein J3R83DRAFT_10218 [Lanmaoa asiatica]|nr:hypothetical protein J3R83DRAFT_10218 [Lanmaoa asiatica]